MIRVVSVLGKLIQRESGVFADFLVDYLLDEGLVPGRLFGGLRLLETFLEGDFFGLFLYCFLLHFKFKFPQGV